MTGPAPGALTAPGPARSGGAQRPAGGGSPAWAGTGRLVRLAVRRDRIMLPAWIYVITAFTASGAYALRGLYPTAAARAELGVSAAHNPALLFLYGPLDATTPGGLVAWRSGAFGVIFAALMTVFLVVRHTRADEEAGRLELAGSAAVARPAPLAAALLTSLTGVAVAVALSFGALLVVGLPATGSAAFALGLGGGGLVFAGVAAVAAQVSGTARGARGLALGLLGASYLVRALGDAAGAAGPSWLAWLSPVGWAGELRPFAGTRWWVLALFAAAAGLATAAAFGLAARRDQGSGLLPARPGPASAGPALRGALGLAWRLQRGGLAGWAAGFLALGAASGAAAKGISGLLGSAPVRQALERLGGQAGATDAYLATVMSLTGLLAAAYATAAVLRLAADESAGLAEPLLAGPVGRIRWAAATFTVAAAGTAVVLAAAGLGAGLGYGLRIGDVGGQVPALLGAALAQLPAALAVAGVAALLFGLRPGWAVPGGWAAFGVAALIALLGPVLRLGHWVTDISPFGHVPRLPGGPVTATPLAWLALVALALATFGLAALRRRDIG